MLFSKKKYELSYKYYIFLGVPMITKKATMLRLLFAVAALSLIPTTLFQAQTAVAQILDDDFAPAPPSIGADVPLTYFGPPPSEVDPNLVGPVELLRAGQVDQEAGTVTLPLYQGRIDGNSSEAGAGETVWYILTDTTDKGNAEALGLNLSPKLHFAAVGNAFRTAILENDTTLIFDGGTVDFSPEHRLQAGNGSNPFPPSVAEPGAIADENYSPIVRIENAGGHIYNAPVVAFGVNASEISFCDGNPDYGLVHDNVVEICPEENTVTLKLANAFSFAKPVFYLPTDASDRLAATLDKAVFAPALATIPVGRDDGAFSAIERLFAITNGPTGATNPQRQGITSALVDGPGIFPLNVVGGIPTVALDYSPLWDINLAEWTQPAIDNGYRSRLIDEFQLLGFAQQGWLTGPGGAEFGSSGIIVNCPIVFRFL